MNKLFKQKNKGFTLVETLVAISIFMIAVVGPMVIVSTGLKRAYFARDQMIATYLAQDAMEALRYRFRNNLNNDALVNGNDVVTSHMDYLDLASGTNCLNNWCRIETETLYEDSNDMGAIDDSTPDTKMEKTAEGLYVFSGASDSPFIRKFRYSLIKVGTNTIGVQVEVKMIFNSGSIDKDFSIYSTFYNWN